MSYLRHKLLDRQLHHDISRDVEKLNKLKMAAAIAETKKHHFQMEHHADLGKLYRGERVREPSDLTRSVINQSHPKYLRHWNRDRSVPVQDLSQKLTAQRLPIIPKSKKLTAFAVHGKQLHCRTLETGETIGNDRPNLKRQRMPSVSKSIKALMLTELDIITWPNGSCMELSSFMRVKDWLQQSPL